MKLKNTVFYLLVITVIFGGQFLFNRGMVTGTPPPITGKPLTVQPELSQLGKGPRMIYFWAEWCGICNMMKGTVTSVLQDYPGITIAVRSGDDAKVRAYLHQQGLDWSVINDGQGMVADRYGVNGVPAAFYLNEAGDIVLTSVGYSSEWGMRFRLWLSALLPAIY